MHQPSRGTDTPRSYRHPLEERERDPDLIPYLSKKINVGEKSPVFPLFTVGIVMRGWITQTQKREHPPNLIPVENDPLLQNKVQYRLGSEIKLKGV